MSKLIEVSERLPVWDLVTNESEPVICLWDDGLISISTSRLIAMDTPSFQRPCGTNEGEEGWDGSVGYVTHWMPISDEIINIRGLLCTN